MTDKNIMIGIVEMHFGIQKMMVYFIAGRRLGVIFYKLVRFPDDKGGGPMPESDDVILFF